MKNTHIEGSKFLRAPRLALPLMMALVLLSLAVPRYAAEKQKSPDPKKIFDAAAKKVDTLDDYYFEFESVEYDTKTKKNETTIVQFWWMKPEFRKLSVLEGKHKGSVAAYNPKKNAKRVFGKQNGVAIPGGVPKESEMVKQFFLVGWQNDFVDLTTATNKGKFKLDGVEAVKETKEAYKITVDKPKSEFSKVIIWIDKKTGVLVKHEYYKQNKFHKSVTLYDIKINSGLKDKDFEI